MRWLHAVRGSDHRVVQWATSLTKASFSSCAHKARAVHLFRIALHSCYVVMPETRQKWQVCVCTCVYPWARACDLERGLESSVLSELQASTTWRSARGLGKGEPSQAFIPDAHKHTKIHTAFVTISCLHFQKLWRCNLSGSPLFLDNRDRPSPTGPDPLPG